MSKGKSKETPYLEPDTFATALQHQAVLVPDLLSLHRLRAKLSQTALWSCIRVVFCESLHCVTFSLSRLLCSLVVDNEDRGNTTSVP